MRAITLLIVALLTAPLLAADDDLSIDDYEFTWKAARSGNATFSIVKTQDDTSTVLTGVIGSVRMSPADAEAISAVLAKVDAVHAKIKGTDKEETIKVGKYVVFHKMSEGSFMTMVTGEGSIDIGATIDRAEAKAMAKAMKRAKKMAALVDAKVNL